MNRSYYCLVRLSKNIKSENILKRVVKMQYEVSRSWAYRHFDDFKTLMSSREQETQTVEMWYVVETDNGVKIETLKSWKSPWYGLAS